jgi:predicted transcriptional regulator
MDQITLAEGTEGEGALERTVAIVVAYVANNSVPAAGLPDLIASVHAALTNLGQVKAEPQREALQPAVSIKKSVTPGYLISLEDGRQYKTLKRHLSGRGLTPDQYRQKWNLPADYPMVAPDYAVRRSQLAKAAGLGRKAATNASATPTTEPKRRGRPPKVA